VHVEDRARRCLPSAIPNQRKYRHLDHGYGQVPPTNLGSLVLIDYLDAAPAFQVMRIKLDCSCDERFVNARRVNPTKFLTELKRRNVYRAAVAYGVVAWFLTQLTTQVFPFFEIPNSAVRFVVIALTIGFPIAMLLSWLYEFTPEGIVRTEDLDPVQARSVQRATGRILDFIIIGVLLLVIAMLIVGRRPFYWQKGESISQKSIAVLPFENLSEDKANAYFADGIQDEILTRLSKIADLKVISRTSTQHYKSAPENLPEIAKQLGVAHILEGRVQKSGDAVRVNVQLIKAANDSHLWADTFDRKLTDIFSVESEVAKAIAEQLRAHLSGQEEQEIAAKPTDNPEAYDAYLRGLAYTLKTATTPANALGAQKYLREAVRLDPKFALSWALLSYVDSRGYLTESLQATVALREEARQAAETALTLQPNLGEAVLAKGAYHYFCLKDYDTAVRYFEQARQFLPNSSRIPESLAYVARRRGQWDRGEAYFIEAERPDPRNVYLLTQHAYSYICLRRFPEALRKLDQVLNIIPDDVDTLATKAGIAQAEGDLPRAAALLAPLHPNADDASALETQVYQAILERRPAQIIPRLKEILAKPDPALGYVNGALRFNLGWAQEVAGDHAVAQETWRQARSELESFLKEQPENDLLIGDLALTNMGLGDKAAALALAERAIAANPIEKDAADGPMPIEIFARVAARMGEPDRAIAALQKLLSIPYEGAFAANVPLTPALLRLDPMFDPLRNDPALRKTRRLACAEKTIKLNHAVIQKGATPDIG
jgi:TolB-like protein/Tfp pilus assembly protein PilF